MSTLRKLRRKGRSTDQKIEPLRHEEIPFARKMSEVLLEFAEPLLEDSFDEEFEPIISFASMCWNCSFLPQKQQQSHLKDIIRSMGKFDLHNRLEAKKWFNMLLERKRIFFADERRIIANYRIIEEEDEHRLIVMSVFAK